MSVLLLLLGLCGLWIGTELALRNTIDLAEKRNMSQGFLGVTVLAVGTDLPELVVAVTGGIRQLQGVEASGVVIGNAIGSAITQGSIVLGIAGLFGNLRMTKGVLRRDAVVLALSLLLLFLFGADGHITRVEASALLIVYVLYYAWLVQAERGRPKEAQEGETRMGRIVLGIAAGVVTVLLSAEAVVENALLLAERWTLDQTVLGVLLVGAGTSLPELALSLGAAAKKRASLSVGNIVGSNVFDLLVPIGASGLIHPLLVQRETLTMDLPFLLLVVTLGLCFFVRRRGLQRGEAITLVVLWVGFAITRLALQPGV